MTRIQKFIITLIITLVVAGYNSNLFSWNLFTLFSDREYSETGYTRAISFDPDRDILYLPPLGDKDLFEAMDDLSICRRQEVRRFLYVYLTSGREYTIRAIERSLVYGDIVKEIFDAHPEVPSDLFLLPLLESGYNPLAVSRSRATGLWQFVANTSRPLGLSRDAYVEERCDIEKSTEAAIRHLKGLYETFGSWDLALAAYNGGAGHVQRARIRTKSSTLWELVEKKALRRETAEYLPRYIALALIYRNQRIFGISNEITYATIPRTENITVPGSLPLRIVASLSGASIDTIRRFNPELRSNIIPPESREYSLRLPVDACAKLDENRETLRRYTYSRMQCHRVRRGECLAHIARRYNQKVDVIREVNDLSGPERLKPGSILYIPM